MMEPKRELKLREHLNGCGLGLTQIDEIIKMIDEEDESVTKLRDDVISNFLSRQRDMDSDMLQSLNKYRKSKISKFPTRLDGK